LFDSCSSVLRGGSIYAGSNNSNIVINNTKIINSSCFNVGGGVFMGSQNTNINFTHCSFIENHSYKGGAIYLDKKNSYINFVGNLFQNNSALVHGGACYFNEANDNILFIDEDSFNSIVLYDSSIPSTSQSFHKLFSDDDYSIVLFGFDPISSDFISIDIKVDNKTIYEALLVKTTVVLAKH
jgi:predicted outer membrane repeat protein